MNVSELSAMPKGPHWAIITGDSIYHEGDERSRTHPGHGYPAYSESVIKYQAFTDEVALHAAIKQLEFPTYGSRKEYRVIRVEPMSVAKEIKLSLTSAKSGG